MPWNIATPGSRSTGISRLPDPNLPTAPGLGNSAFCGFAWAHGCERSPNEKHPILGIFLEGDASDRGRKNQTLSIAPSSTFTRHQRDTSGAHRPQAPMSDCPNRLTFRSFHGSDLLSLQGSRTQGPNLGGGHRTPTPQPSSKKNPCFHGLDSHRIGCDPS